MIIGTIEALLVVLSPLGVSLVDVSPLEVSLVGVTESVIEVTT